MFSTARLPDTPLKGVLFTYENIGLSIIGAVQIYGFIGQAIKNAWTN